MASRKVAVVSVGALSLAVAAWVGGSVLVGQRAETALQAMKNAPSAPGRGQAMEARDMDIDVDLRNRRLGTGTASVSAAQVSFGAGTLEGVSLRSEASERGDRLDMTLTPAVRA